MPYLDRDGEVFILYLGNEGQTDSENRFHPDWMEEVHAKLDEVEASEGPAALVTTATGKFYSNGLDTDWLFGNFDRMHWYLDRVHSIFARLLTFPMPTVAAVNGHAFGAGAMTAISNDFRVMRGDRGFFSLPEVKLNMPFTVGMNALVSTRLSNQAAVATMTTGDRIAGPDAQALGIVDATADGDGLVAAAVARAAGLVSNRGPAIARIKADLHATIIAALTTPNTPENLKFGG